MNLFWVHAMDSGLSTCNYVRLFSLYDAETHTLKRNGFQFDKNIRPNPTSQRVANKCPIIFLHEASSEVALHFLICDLHPQAHGTFSSRWYETCTRLAWTCYWFEVFESSRSVSPRRHVFLVTSKDVTDSASTDFSFRIEYQAPCKVSKFSIKRNKRRETNGSRSTTPRNKWRYVKSARFSLERYDQEQWLLTDESSARAGDKCKLFFVQGWQF